jgi:hypothetical protein
MFQNGPKSRHTHLGERPQAEAGERSEALHHRPGCAPGAHSGRDSRLPRPLRDVVRLSGADAATARQDPATLAILELRGSATRAILHPGARHIIVWIWIWIRIVVGWIRIRDFHGAQAGYIVEFSMELLQ